MSHISVLGYSTNLGLPVPVQTPAPQTLRNLGLIEALNTAGYTVRDLGDMALPDGTGLSNGEDALAVVTFHAQRQAEQLRQHWSPGTTWVTLGGDHSTSLGTAMGLSQIGLEFDIVWIDAHADFNTPATSPSGNPHGMVLAQVAGLTPDLLPKLVPPQRIHILGLRSVDAGERALLQQHGVHTYTVAETLANLDEIIAGLRPHVFLSLDVDAIDPQVARAVRTPVPDGFTAAEAAEIVARITEARTVLAIDLVEYAPDLDDSGHTTSRMALAWLLASTPPIH